MFLRIKGYLEKRIQFNALRELRGIEKISPALCEIRGKKLLNFSSNDYLALSVHPDMIVGSERWLSKYGTSLSASRLICGTMQEILDIEEKIAVWKGCEAAIILGSGFLANCGAIAAFAGRDTAIFADKLNHASLNAGCLMSGAEFLRYRHCDYSHLEYLLRNSQSKEKVIVSDTIFSMDGDIADLNILYELADKYDAMLYLDDAHATGVFGEKGEGLGKAENINPERLILMGTFSKGFGAYGAYIAGTKKNIQYLVNACSSFIYSTALPPTAYGAIEAGLDLIQKEETRTKAVKLLENANYVLTRFRSIGLNCGKSASQIIPLILGDNVKTLSVSEQLFENGIFAAAIRPPTVPERSARIRFSLNAAHIQDDITFAIKTITKIVND